MKNRHYALAVIVLIMTWQLTGVAALAGETGATAAEIEALRNELAQLRKQLDETRQLLATTQQQLDAIRKNVQPTKQNEPVKSVEDYYGYGGPTRAYRGYYDYPYVRTNSSYFYHRTVYPVRHHHRKHIYRRSFPRRCYPHYNRFPHRRGHRSGFSISYHIR